LCGPAPLSTPALTREDAPRLLQRPRMHSIDARCIVSAARNLPVRAGLQSCGSNGRLDAILAIGAAPLGQGQICSLQLAPWSDIELNEIPSDLRIWRHHAVGQRAGDQQVPCTRTMCAPPCTRGIAAGRPSIGPRIHDCGTKQSRQQFKSAWVGVAAPRLSNPCSSDGNREMKHDQRDHSERTH
jgi:hypothetical protein